jgi:ABC-type transporter Mla MlaB component
MLSMTQSRTIRARIRGPLERRDLPGLYARLCAHLAATHGGTLVCDVGAVAVDAVAVEALARLQLGARRNGCRVIITNAPDQLGELIALFGLEGVLAAA